MDNVESTKMLAAIQYGCVISRRTDSHAWFEHSSALNNKKMTKVLRMLILKNPLL